jgi:hypothetical protein
MEGIMKKIFIAVFIFIAINISFPLTAHCVDTKDWEGLLHLQLFGAKPEKAWLLNTAYFILFDSIKPTPKGSEYFDKYYDSKSNSLTIPLKNPWHDIEMMLIIYSKLEEVDGYLFGVTYKFKKRSFNLLDVLGRYGYKSAEIKTNSDLSKEIVYSLKKGEKINRDSPLYCFVPLKDDQITTLVFHSPDKVFIDTLTVASYLKMSEISK